MGATGERQVEIKKNTFLVMQTATQPCQNILISTSRAEPTGSCWQQILQKRFCRTHSNTPYSWTSKSQEHKIQMSDVNSLQTQCSFLQKAFLVAKCPCAWKDSYGLTKSMTSVGEHLEKKTFG